MFFYFYFFIQYLHRFGEDSSVGDDDLFDDGDMLQDIGGDLGICHYFIFMGFVEYIGNGISVCVFVVFASCLGIGQRRLNMLRIVTPWWMLLCCIQLPCLHN